MIKRYVKRYSPYANAKRSRKLLSVVPISKKAARKGKSLVRQVKALIASKKKEAADVDRDTASLTATTASCLTSSTGFTTAASGTGLLDMDGDECLVNHVRIKGFIANTATLDLDPVGNTDAQVRNLVVYFNKPLLVASAAGTLPPITEVLVTDELNSMFVTPAANGGRFTVLSDKTWNFGSNTFQAATAVGHARVNGTLSRIINYKVKVNKMVKYAAPGVSGAPSGHYDSDVAAGRVDKGLIVFYQMVFGNTGQTINSNLVTRLNYTG